MAILIKHHVGGSGWLRVIASDFSDAEDVSNQPASSQWLISKVSGDYSGTNLIYDSGPITDGSSHVVAIDLPQDLNYYYWKMRYQDSDGVWSLYAFQWRFKVTLSGAVAHWRFDEGGGHIANDELNSPFGNSGTLTDATGDPIPYFTSSGKYNGGVEFSGKSGFTSNNYSYVDFGDPSDGDFDFGSGDFSVEGWFKVDSAKMTVKDQDWAILDKDIMSSMYPVNGWSVALGTWQGSAYEQGDPFVILFSTTGYVGFANVGGQDYTDWGDQYACSAASLLAADPLYPDQWYHFVAVRDIDGGVGTLLIYVNGEFLDSTTDVNCNINSTSTNGNTTDKWAKIDVDNTAPLTLGKTSMANSASFPGTIDEVILYKGKALTAEEVAARYTASGGVIPYRPTNFSPAASETGVSLRPNFLAFYSDPGNEAQQSAHWQFRKSTGSYGDSTSYDLTTIDDLVGHTLPTSNPLITDTVYYWRVQHQNIRGAWSAYSEETSFRSRTNTKPGQPTNVSPDAEDGVPVSPILASSAFSDATDIALDPNGEYHAASWWQISTSAAPGTPDNPGDYTSPVYNESNTELTEHAVPVSKALSTNELYYWHVKHMDSSGTWSNWSIDTTFETGTNVPPKQPVNQTPTDGKPYELRIPTLTADQFSDPEDGTTGTASQWQITSVAGDYSSPDYEGTSPQAQLSSHTVAQELDYNTTYYWRVRYQDANLAWSQYSQQTSFTTTVLAEGAVAYWKLDNKGPSDTIAYDEINSSNGTLFEARWNTAGKHDGALKFDGNDDYVDLGEGNGNVLRITGDQSIEVWVNPTNFDAKVNIYEKAYAGEGSLIVETDGTVTYRYGTCGGNCTPSYQSFNTSVSIAENEWTHLVIVRDLTNGTLTWYKNGEETGSATASYTPVSSTLPAYIGDGASGNFKGYIDDLVIYDRAITSDEVKARYGASLSSVRVRDILGQGPYVQTGDQVVVEFDGATQGNLINSSNVANALALKNGHTWFSSSGSIGSMVWESNVYSNDTLVITLSVPDGDTPPTVAPGDTVTLQGGVFKDTTNRAITGAVTITGDFANQLPYQPVGFSPVHNTTNVTLQPELRVTLFSDPDAGFFNPDTWDMHQATQWQVSTVSGGSFEDNIVYSAVTALAKHTLTSLLEPEKPYYWHARHQDNDDAWSPYSEVHSFTTTLRPKKPTNTYPLNGASGAGGDRLLKCDLGIPFDSFPADKPWVGFMIERKTGVGGAWSQIATVANTVNTYQDTGLTSTTTYYYRVRAYNASATSDLSNERSATTQ